MNEDSLRPDPPVPFDVGLALRIVIGVVGYTAWAIMSFLDPALRIDFLHFNMAMVGGTIGLVLRDMPPANK